MSAGRTYRGYARQTKPTAELAIGDVIYFPGLSAHADIMSIRRDGEDTVLTTTYDYFGRQRRAIVRRKAAGTSTVLVRTQPADGAR